MDGAVYVILLVARVRPCTYHPKITGGDDEQKVPSEDDPGWTSWWEVALGGKFWGEGRAHVPAIGSGEGIT